MADIAVPLRQAAPFHVAPAQDDDAFSVPLRYSSGGLEQSHTPFDFSMPSSEQTETQTAAPSLRRQRHPGGHTRNRSSINTLPSFSFNASDASGRSGDSSPSLTDSFPEDAGFSTRATRHKRSASELVGPNNAGGAHRLRSRSPNKHDLQTPPASPVRRGHAHRRSGAVSSQDLSALNRPASPAVPFQIRKDEVIAPAPSLSVQDHPQVRPPSQARVGFSDTLEFIPRPLSTISSETESSMSTIRGEHSLAGSISSVLSAGVASPSPRRSPPKDHRSGEGDQQPSRPRSAGTVLDFSRRGIQSAKQELAQLRRPRSAYALTSPSVVPKTQEVIADQRVEKFLAHNDYGQRDPGKQRKVRSWASSFVPRRSKEPLEKPRPLSTPASTSHNLSHPWSVPDPAQLQLSENFDDDPTATIVYDTPSFTTKIAPRNDHSLAAATVLSASATTPVIDIDDAAIPMESGSAAISTHSLKNRSFSTARLSMHSSGSTGGFTGPGMHYHRRTESAPQLVPADFERPILRRLHSSSSTEAVHEMENVFEEDEEEDADGSREVIRLQEGRLTPLSSKDNEGQDVQIVEEGDNITRSDTLRSAARVKAGRSKAPPPSISIAPIAALIPLIKDATDSSDSVVIVDEDLEAHRVSYITGSSNSTITSVLPDTAKETPDADELAFTFQPARSPPDTPTYSSFLSPRYGYQPSHILFTPYLETAASSTSELRKITTGTPGEQGFEYRPSTDDVPSLISSRSGSQLTSSAAHTHIPSVSSRNYNDGTASFRSSTSASFNAERRRKRSSIVSLSRLVGGPFGEKSKLSNEPFAERPGTAPDKHIKERKKSRRLGRLLHFWKQPKEAAWPS